MRTIGKTCEPRSQSMHRSSTTGDPPGRIGRTEQKPFRMGNVSEWRDTTDAGFGGDAPVKPMKQLHITTGSRCMAT